MPKLHCLLVYFFTLLSALVIDGVWICGLSYSLDLSFVCDLIFDLIEAAMIRGLTQ